MTKPDTSLLDTYQEFDAETIALHAPEYERLRAEPKATPLSHQVKTLEDVRAVVAWWCAVSAHSAANPNQPELPEIAQHETAAASAYRNILGLLDRAIARQPARPEQGAFDFESIA